METVDTSPEEAIEDEILLLSQISLTWPQLETAHSSSSGRRPEEAVEHEILLLSQMS